MIFSFRHLIKTISAFSFFLISSSCCGEIHPTNGSMINYTQVMFEYDPVPFANHYRIVLGSDENKSFFLEVENKSLACIISGLQFGGSYKWHYEAWRKNEMLFKSDEFRFKINRYPLIDTSLYKATVDVAKKNFFQNDILFIDFLGIAIDRSGQPVWFYPSTPQDGRIEPNFRNVRMTNNGTITFQDNDNCYETDINGRILWKAPNDGRVSGDKREFYHHDFRKLKDGSFLTTSYQYVQEPNFFKPSVTSRVRYNTLIEYDASGNIKWTWNEKDHVKKEVLFQGLDSNATEVEGTHLNGFDYDESEDAIVMSFRNNSSILKIDKRTGKIIYDLSAYGAQSGRKDPWFSRQHGPMLLPGHRLLVYNNNAKDTITGISYPKLLIVQEPVNGNIPKIEFEFECKSDRYPKGIIGKEGYCFPLSNGNFLVCVGGANFSFEVTPKKEIVWRAYFQKLDPEKKLWTGFNNYRCTAASSLYPRYFTLEQTFTGKKTSGIRINNEGTDEEKFKVEILTGGQKRELLKQEVVLPARSSTTIEIPRHYLNDGNEISVLVTPFANPLFPKLRVIKSNMKSKK